MRRRQFITLLGGTTAMWSFAARAQRPALPVVGYVGSSVGGEERSIAGFRKGLSETGYIEGQNVTVEYHGLDAPFDGLPVLMADLVRRRVAVIVTFGIAAARAAKAATATIPIVFAHGDDPAKLGLVANLARPGGNLTGVSFFNAELIGKRLNFLHELLPKAIRVALLVNPAGPIAESTLRQADEAAGVLGLQIQTLNASTIGEIDAAFATLKRDRPDALFVDAGATFASRTAQLVTLSVRDKIPAAFSGREAVALGGLMSYGIDIADSYHQVGVYTGRILKGAKPVDLPVVQPTRFVFAVNMRTARALGIEVPPQLLAITDEAIE
jgi:putative ABC transport system substrate-binding protein